MKIEVYQVDSFTKELFKGNPAGVVVNADGLSDNQMQNIARELNNSETAFILSPTSNDHDIWVRFFTPQKEVPICGHATIAAHYVRAKELNLESCVVIQKTGAGVLPVEIIKTDDYKIKMTQGNIEFGQILELGILKLILDALNIEEINLLTECPIQIVSTGHSKVIIGLNSSQLLNSLSPNYNNLIEISKLINCNGFFAFAFNTNKKESLTVGRMFAPAIGINEDPVTGNANGPLGAYLVKHNLVKHDSNLFNFTGIQGEAIGRRGKIEVEVDIFNNLPQKVRISGNAVIAFNTEIEI